MQSLNTSQHFGNQCSWLNRKYGRNSATHQLWQIQSEYIWNWMHECDSADNNNNIGWTLDAIDYVAASAVQTWIE